MERPARLQGTFSVMAVADLVQWAWLARKTGLLKLNDGAGKEIQVTLQDGRIVCSSTNSQRETYGGYLRLLRLCSDAEIERAVKRCATSEMMLGALLVSTRKLDEKVAVDTLTRKTVEDLCDVFLWRDGLFELITTPYLGKKFLPIDLDPLDVLTRGLQRKAVWERLGAHIHPHSVFETTTQARPPGAGDAASWVRAKVFALIDGERDVEDLLALVPFSRYQVYFSLAELLHKRRIRSADRTEVGLREARFKARLEEARLAIRGGRWGEASHILEGLATAHPGNTSVQKELTSAREGFRAHVLNYYFDYRDVPAIAVSSQTLARLDLDQEAGFVLSRIDGELDVEQILKIIPVLETTGLAILKRLLDSKVIGFPYR